MRTTRRSFLVVSGAVSAGLLLRPRLVGAAPAGTRTPAPQATQPATDAAASALAGSRLLADEPLARLAVEQAKKAGATYADARLVLWTRRDVSVRDDHISRVAHSEEYGIGVRVVADGAWGFAATNRLDRAAVTKVAKQAVRGAKLSGRLLGEVGGEPVELAPTPVVDGKWVSPHELDPFSTAIEDQAELLMSATRELLAVAGVHHARGGIRSVREEKLLVTSEGSRVHQLYFRTRPGLSATAIDRRRGRFASREHEAAPMLAGWEYVRDIDLIGSARALGEGAVQKLHAASVEPGRKKVVLTPSNLWLTIHESIGHPTELDRARGLEANFAGTSFIRPEDTGELQLGSEIVNVVADRTQPGGLATTGWDDEGVPAQRWDIVRDGKLVGWQTTRAQAAWIGESASRGCSYANGFDDFQFQRMPNISLQPGKEGYTTEDLINSTDDGILVAGRGSWSIDHQRRNFQFGGQSFWEIKNGRLTRQLRDVAYRATTTDFWRSCDMLGGEGTYRLGGSFADGKGEPAQLNAVSHGCPPARFEASIVNTGEDR
jgi:TldD protein